MRERQLEDWEGWSSSAAMMAARAARTRSPGWVLEHTEGAVVGCTTVSDRPLDEGWTTAEREETALYLHTTVTDPAWRGFTLVRTVRGEHTVTHLLARQATTPDWYTTTPA